MRTLYLGLGSMVVGAMLGVAATRLHRQTHPPLDVTSLRDIRIECLAAILHRIPKAKWDAMTAHMEHSPNVCLIAQFVYSNKDLPDPDAIPEPVKAATEAVDHAHTP